MLTAANRGVQKGKILLNIITKHLIMINVNLRNISLTCKSSFMNRTHLVD